MGFVNDVRKIVKLTPKNRQTIIILCTMPIAIRELAENFLNDPATVSVSSGIVNCRKCRQRHLFC